MNPVFSAIEIGITDSLSTSSYMRIKFLLILIVLTMMPHLIPPSWFPSQLTQRPDFRFKIITGDEPHYLAMINSFLRDGDLNLRNNYDASRNGINQLGERFIFDKTVHHTVLYANNELIDNEGNPEKFAEFTHGVEFSRHPFGMPVLFGCIISLLHVPNEYTEPISLILCGLCIIGTIIYLSKTAQYLGAGLRNIHTASILFLIGTPFWFYSRSLFSESLLSLCTSGMFYYFFCSRQDLLLAGIWLAIGIFAKPVILVCGFPFLFHVLLIER